MSKFKVDCLQVEKSTRPIGIDVVHPHFSWEFTDEEDRAVPQARYQIQVWSAPELLHGHDADLWQSSLVATGRTFAVAYEGPVLASNRRYFWRVSAEGQGTGRIDSEPSWWDTGLIDEKEWTGFWIGDDWHPGMGLPRLKRTFSISSEVARAFLYISGLGQFEAALDGRRLGDSVLQPGWTNYHKTCLYAAFDLSQDLTCGEHSLNVLLGNGFFNVVGGRYTKYRGSFGVPQCRVELIIDYVDGRRERIASDRRWLVSEGPIVFSCVYGGEDYDARLETKGSPWREAQVFSGPQGHLRFDGAPSLAVRQRFRPQQISRLEKGGVLVDFGQNFSGWPSLRLRGAPGHKVILRPGERLNDGRVDQSQSGHPVEFGYTLKGDASESWHPRFSYYGFRYLEMMGVRSAYDHDHPSNESPGDAWLEEVVGEMIYPRVESVGRFSCSDPLINQIHAIINAAILSNMKSVFTDCPHREKLGWLEQLHLMGPSIRYNYDVESLWQKILTDIRDAQLENGMVPSTAPEYTVFDGPWSHFRDTVGWGIAYPLLAIELLLRYGNRRGVEEHYPNIVRYLEYVEQHSDGGIVSQGLGDWYDVGEKPPGYAQNTPVALVETALYCHMIRVAHDMAKTLGRSSEEARWGQRAAVVQDAFNRRFFDADRGGYRPFSQSANALALALNLVPEAREKDVLAILTDDIEAHGQHTTAGDVGHRFVLQALAESGRSDLILAMALKTDHPSYGYQVVHGATTLTEAWDGPTIGKSQNHFMLGHLEEWLYRWLAGIDYTVDAAGTYQVVLAPALLEGLEWVRAEHRIAVGWIVVEWKRVDRSFTLMLDVPRPCRLTVDLPEDFLMLGGKGLELKRSPDGRFRFCGQGGRYQFSSAT